MIKKTIQINKRKQIAFVSANVLIGDLIEKTMPLGLFPAVVPGTKFITIGGAIASDILVRIITLMGVSVIYFIIQPITKDGRTLV